MFRLQGALCPIRRKKLEPAKKCTEVKGYIYHKINVDSDCTNIDQAVWIYVRFTINEAQIQFKFVNDTVSVQRLKKAFQVIFSKIRVHMFKGKTN